LSAHRTARHARCAWLVATTLLSAVLGLGCSGGDETQPAPPPPAADEGEPPSEGVQQAARPRGLWVLAEGSQRVLDDAARVDELVERAQNLRATDLFVHVDRGGRAGYDAALAADAPSRAAIAAGSADPLALWLVRAPGAGLRVHAWVNVLSLSKNADAPIVRDLGRDVVHSDRKGRSLLDYPDYEIPQPDRRHTRMGTPGVYLDPAAPGVAERLSATFAELLARYPQLDGLHLDYIRYPDVLPYAPGSRFGVGHDFGYGSATRARFRRETGLEAPLGDRVGPANAWDDWRRDKLTELVRSIRDAARAASPGVVLSAAVWTYADRGYLVLGQDWRRWLEDDLLDVAVPMSYTLDDRLLRYQAESFAGLPLADRIWMGLGCWLFASEPQRALAQVEILRTAGVRGESLFSYDSIVSEPALWSAFTGERGDVDE
jgi:uncharacterized lipoprotein YddW (UPF0748 family)